MPGTVAIGILPSLHHRLFGSAKDVTGGRGNLWQVPGFFMMSVAVTPTFDARHEFSSFVRRLITGQQKAAFAP